MRPEQITIVHIDRFPEIRDFVKERLETQGMKIVGSSDNYPIALKLIKETTPHILLYSLKWIDEISINHFKDIKKLFPSLKIILLTIDDSEKMAALTAGNGLIDGLIGKDQSSLDLYDCITSLVEINQSPFSKN
jgi:DNA-binding NarL/FixJ family response regulator